MFLKSDKDPAQTETQGPAVIMDKIRYVVLAICMTHIIGAAVPCVGDEGLVECCGSIHEMDPVGDPLER